MEESDDSSGDEAIDHANYKGIYIDEEPGQKFTDPDTGAHFDFEDMCHRLKSVEKERRSVDARVKYDQQLLDSEECDEMSNIYKSQGTRSKQHIIHKDTGKNKQEIINQLNKKIEGMFRHSLDEKKQELNIKVGNSISKFFYISCCIVYLKSF